MTEAYIYDAVRTPRGKGKKDGSLHEITGLSLISQCLTALQKRHDLDTSKIDDVILGCVTPIGELGANIARSAVLNAGWDESVSGMQINRFCASGLDAVNMASAQIMSGAADLVVGGGIEIMSRVAMGSDGGALLVDPSLNYDHYIVPQGISADLIATKYGYSREDCDLFAVESQKRAAKAWEENRFKSSIIPITDQLGLPLLDHDEYIRPDTDMEALSKLQPAFEQYGMYGFSDVAIQRYPELEKINYVHHAGNSSGVVDGAAAVLIGSLEAGKALGLTPRARIKAFTSIGSEPTIMLTGPVLACRKLIKRANISVNDIDLFEMNEAFSAVVLRFMDDLGVSHDQTNVNGGAIAMGHPLGATGAMLVGTLLDELERSDREIGLVTLCVAAGMATASLIERV